MSGVLAKILATKRAQVAAMIAARAERAGTANPPSAAARAERAGTANPPSAAPCTAPLANDAAGDAAVRDVFRAPDGFRPRGAEVLARLRRPPGAALRLVTEIKRRSPSAGPLSTALSVAERARVYAAGGATMISVLADRAFFDGGWDCVADARRALAVGPATSAVGPATSAVGPATSAVGSAAPLVLAKEFVIDRVQIDAAAASGADAVLLIVRCVDRATLAELVVHARARGLEPLVEVVDEAELDVALAAGAKVVGVNARDLDTLVMDADRTTRVLAKIPANCTKLHLSGLRTAADIAAIARTNADAALIGEALMRLDDPAPLLRAMRDAAVG